LPVREEPPFALAELFLLGELPDDDDRLDEPPVAPEEDRLDLDDFAEPDPLAVLLPLDFDLLPVELLPVFLLPLELLADLDELDPPADLLLPDRDPLLEVLPAFLPLLLEAPVDLLLPLPALLLDLLLPVLEAPLALLLLLEPLPEPLLVFLLPPLELLLLLEPLLDFLLPLLEPLDLLLVVLVFVVGTLSIPP